MMLDLDFPSYIKIAGTERESFARRGDAAFQVWSLLGCKVLHIAIKPWSSVVQGPCLQDPIRGGCTQGGTSQSLWMSVDFNK